MMARKHGLGAAGMAMLVALAACGPDEDRLPGPRIAVRPDAGGGQENVARPIDLPAQVNHAAWTHVGGGPTHAIQHPALDTSLARVWSAEIGAAASARQRITADPVVAGGRVFTLDALSRVSAHSTAGRALWSQTLVPAPDSAEQASGGGLAYGGGRLFVTTGFGQIFALDPASGGAYWRQDLDAPVIGAPTVRDGTVYAVSRDNRAVAIDAATGRLQWQLPGAPSPSGRVPTASPAVSARFAILPYASSEVTAALRENGLRLWSAPLSGRRRGRVYATFSDITGDPVVEGATTYAATPTGRLVALDTASGERRWTAAEGALSPVWVAGGSVFLVSDLNELVRLDAATGERIWGVQLPYYKDERARQRKGVYAQYGPVLAGGRLLVASSEGVLRAFDPVSGRPTARIPLPAPATSNPVVVDGTLYLVTDDGRLHAFR